VVERTAERRRGMARLRTRSSPCSARRSALTRRPTPTRAAAGRRSGLRPGEQSIPDDLAEDFERRLEEISGEDAARMLVVSKVIDEHHPSGSYYFLQFMGVEPESQGGSARR
jgi:hypothetical protein